MMNDLSRLLLALVRIDSLTGAEKPLSDFIRNRYAGFGDAVFAPQGYTSLYPFVFDPALPTIGLYGHIDTVTNQQTFEPVEKDGLIFGCGASDMKGGLAVMLGLMDLLQAGRKPKYNLYFVFYDREEGPTKENGLFDFLPAQLPRLKCDLALVLEPTDNSIQKGCVGSLHVRLSVPGKSGHSARPWEGVNAVHNAWPILKKLDETPPFKVTVDGLDFYEVFSATLARGGQTRNAVPASFVLDINYRFAPGRSNDEATRAALEFCQGPYNLEVSDVAPAGAVVSENRLLSLLTGSFSLQTLPKQAWTDIAQLNNYGIPAVNFGPGSPAMAHQKDEYIRKDHLLNSFQMLTEFLFA